MRAMSRHIVIGHQTARKARTRVYAQGCWPPREGAHRTCSDPRFPPPGAHREGVAQNWDAAAPHAPVGPRSYQLAAECTDAGTVTPVDAPSANLQSDPDGDDGIGRDMQRLHVLARTRPPAPAARTDAAVRGRRRVLHARQVATDLGLDTAALTALLCAGELPGLTEPEVAAYRAAAS